MTNPDQIDRSTHPTSPRQRQPTEHLWAIRKDGQQLDCELRDCGLWGVEVQLYREREFLYGRRWATRALALNEADHHQTAYLQKGGILIA
jgi:hypothetical protein